MRVIKHIIHKQFVKTRIFIGEASVYANDKSNSHASVSFRLINELSERLPVQKEFYDVRQWEGKEKQIRAICMDMYNEFKPPAYKNN